MKSTVPTMSMLDMLEPEDRGSLKTRRLFGRLYLVDHLDQRKNLCPACGHVLDGRNDRTHDGWTVCYSCGSRLSAKSATWQNLRKPYTCIGEGCSREVFVEVPAPLKKDAPVWEWNNYRRAQQRMTGLCYQCEWDLKKTDDDDDQEDEDS